MAASSANSGGPGQSEQGQTAGRTVEQRESDLAKAREVADEVRAREAAEQRQERSQEREQETPDR